MTSKPVRLKTSWIHYWIEGRGGGFFGIALNVISWEALATTPLVAQVPWS